MSTCLPPYRPGFTEMVASALPAGLLALARFVQGRDIPPQPRPLRNRHSRPRNALCAVTRAVSLSQLDAVQLVRSTGRHDSPVLNCRTMQEGKGIAHLRSVPPRVRDSREPAHTSYGVKKCLRSRSYSTPLFGHPRLSTE